MNAEKRFLRPLAREEPDRCPVFLRDLTLALDHAGLSTAEVCSGPYDGRLSAEAVLSYHRRTGQDAVVGCIHHLGLGMEMLGGEVSYPERGIPSVVRHPFGGAPMDGFPDVDPRKDGEWPQVLESYRLVHESGIDAAVVCNLEGPLTRAATLRGLEELMMDLHSEPDHAQGIVRFATETALDMVDAFSEWSDCVFLASASDNPDLFGPELFLELTVPGLARLASAAEDKGLPTVFHPHGDFSAPENAAPLRSSLETGIEGFQFAEGNDHVSLRDGIGDRVCLMGGIEVSSTLLLGPESRIARETEAYLEGFRPWDAYVFMCSCSLHRGMPLHHVDAMLEAVRSYR